MVKVSPEVMTVTCPIEVVPIVPNANVEPPDPVTAERIVEFVLLIVEFAVTVMASILILPVKSRIPPLRVSPPVPIWPICPIASVPPPLIVVPPM
jgi:hypothetical protein